MTTDSQHMARALQLARRGSMTTHPNPRVGCLLVKDGQVIAEGWHERAGGPHAEVVALQQARDKAAGATAYVTLEPCSHHGRTPPCAEALIKSGVSRVVVAMSDPNPLVSGQGLSALQGAGIEVSHGLLATEAEQLNRGFCKRMRSGRPWVSLKLAMTLDGRSAAADGSSQWITSEPARQDVHRQRAEAGAVLTGIGSVLADDSRLNVRLDEVEAAPRRIVLDSRLRMPTDAAMLSTTGAVTLLTCSDDADKRTALQNVGAEVVELPANAQGQVDLQAALDWLGEAEVNQLLVECGATLAGAFIEADLVDELVCYIAPKLLGDDGKGLMSLPALQNIAQARGLTFTDMRAVGPDWRITAKVSD